MISNMIKILTMNQKVKKLMRTKIP